MSSIAEARRHLKSTLTPTLRRYAESEFIELYEGALEAARLALLEHGEDQAAAALPAACPHTLDQVLDRSSYPELPRSGSKAEEGER